MPFPEALKSTRHPLPRQARALAKGPALRREEGLFLIEGARGLEEALTASVTPTWVLVAASKVESDALAALLAAISRQGTPVQPVQDALLEKIAPSEHGPGLLAACHLPADADRAERVLDTQSAGLLVVCCGIQNPGNLGTLQRSAAAFGARGLIALGGADPWGPKAVRASAGAIHRLPVARCTNAQELGAALHARGLTRVAAVARGGLEPSDVDWSAPSALLLGAEVAGLPAELAEGATEVTIPMADAVESLSVPIAGSILLERARAGR